MIEIKYVNPDRSKLFEEINAKFVEPGDKPVNIELSSSSKYSGNFEVEIGSDQGSFKVDGFKNKDETRFPQRIKVLASILRNRGLRGVYQLTTQSNILTKVLSTTSKLKSDHTSGYCLSNFSSFSLFFFTIE